MSGLQRLAGGKQTSRRAANENDAATRHAEHVKPAMERRGSPLTSLKNQSVIRAFAILKSFHHPEEWVAACELARRTRIHEASVNRFLQSLTDVGAVVREVDGRYRCVLFAMPGNHGGPFAGRSERSRTQPESRVLS